MLDPTLTAAPLPLRIGPDDPSFNPLAAYAWANKIRRRGGVIEFLSIRPWGSSQVARVYLDDEEYILYTIQTTIGWHIVMAMHETETKNDPSLYERGPSV